MALNHELLVQQEEDVQQLLLNHVYFLQKQKVQTY